MVLQVVLIVALAFLIGGLLAGLLLGFLINYLVDKKWPKIRYRTPLRVLIYIGSIPLAYFILSKITGIGVSLG
jgi:hypothetical protein